MLIRGIRVSNLRILEQVSLQPADSLTVLIGPNGSGKTSVLEAIHMLGTGRSFRSRRLRDLVRRGQESLVVSGTVVGEDGLSTTVGVEQAVGGTQIRVGGERAKASSALAHLLPLVVVTPDSQRLLTDGADLRRRLIDWSLFHVEHGYGELHQRFRRALRQRVALLRAGTTAVSVAPWNQEVGEAGERLHDARARLLDRVLPVMGEALASLLSVEVRIDYRPGWDTGQPLVQALEAATPADLARGFGDIGPQRADLRFTVAGRPAQHVLSRGEAKLFVAGMVLGQANHLHNASGRAPVVLVDDLGSELDADNRSRFFGALLASRAQTFVTTVSADMVDATGWTEPAMFHVEQGKVSPML